MNTMYVFTDVSNSSWWQQVIGKVEHVNDVANDFNAGKNEDGSIVSIGN